jgi:hypothetical protein
VADGDGDDDEPLTLVEAFRILLRARRPGSLADEIDSYNRLHYRPDGSNRDPDEAADAVATSKQLDEAIRDYLLPMTARRGRRGPFQPVGREDQRLSDERHIFKSELRFYWPGGLVVDWERSFSECTVRRGAVLGLIQPAIQQVVWTLGRAVTSIWLAGVRRIARGLRTPELPAAPPPGTEAEPPPAPAANDAAPGAPAVGEPAEAESDESPRGTPEQYDWDEGFRYVRKLWAELGDPRRPENAKDGWRADADVGRAVQEYIRKPDPKEPGSFKEPDFKHTMNCIRPLLKELRGAHKGA